MLRLFASNQTLSVVFFPMLLILNMVVNANVGLFDGWKSFQTNLWGIPFGTFDYHISNVILVIFLSLTAITINFTFNQHEFYERNTSLPGFIYVLLVMFFPYSVILNGDVFAQLFLALAVNQFLNIKQNEDARFFVFNSAFLLGIAATFNPIYAGFLPLLWFGLSSVRPFVLREHVLILVAFAFPVVWLFVINIEILDVIFKEMEITEIMLGNFYLSTITHFVVLVLFLIALRFLMVRFTKSSIRFKRLIRMILIFLIFPIVFGVIMYYSKSSDYVFSIGIIFLPFILVYTYVDIKNKLIPNLLFYSLIIVHALKFII